MATPETSPESRLSLIPAFAQPAQPDPPLPPVDGPTPTPGTGQDGPTLSQHQPGPKSPNGQDATPTGTSSPGSRWRPGGRPSDVAEVLVGLLVLATGGLALLAARRSRTFRQPTPRQATDISEPLARIACRHLPMDAVGPDLADATKAAGALHAYLFDGPLVQRAVDAIPDPTE